MLFVTSLLALLLVYPSVMCLDDAPSILLAGDPPPMTGCELLINQTDCKCANKKDNTFAVFCDLAGDQELRAVFESISVSSFARLDRVTIRQCHKQVDLLEPLPALNVRSLQVSGCGIKRVDANAFIAMADTLEELNLSNNSITNMPDLKSLRKLKSVNINFNLLKDIPEMALQGLTELRQLRLKGNKMCMLLPKALSETKPNLELLDLSRNCFSVVPSQNLRDFTNLTHISLAGNQITELGQSQFVNMPNLQEVRLSSNQIKSIAHNAFSNLTQVTVFNLANNSLTFVERSMFTWAKNLTDLRLNDNQIKGIGLNAFADVPQLTTLNLANNRLEFIERNTFESAKKLKHLLLHANDIADVHGAAFSSTTDLVVVDLAGNRLQKINKGTFAKLTKIYFIDLSRNLLSTFECESFPYQVSNMFIDENPLNCDSRLDWFINYLVHTRVRVFMPTRPGVKCAAPPNMQGVNFKELVMKRAKQYLAVTTPPPN